MKILTQNNYLCTFKSLFGSNFNLVLILNQVFWEARREVLRMKIIFWSLVLLNLALSAQCHELLLDFVNFEKEHGEIKLTQKCAKSLNEIKNGIAKKELWTLKLRDASGRPSSGFVWGNNFWLGSEANCNQLMHPREIPLSSSKTRRMQRNNTAVISKVPVKYRMFYAAHTSPIQFDTEMENFDGLHIGLCFPKFCEEREVNKMAKFIFESKKFQNKAIYGTISFNKTKTLDLRENYFHEPISYVAM